MKMSWSQMIAVVCILAVGFIGLFPLVNTADAHPKRLDYKYTIYWCYEKSPGWMSLCKSWTDPGSRAVWPWADHWAEPKPHKTHPTESNTHDDYDYDNYTRTSCSKC